MTDKLNISLIGLGTHGLRGHYEPLVRSPAVEIISGFDPSPEVSSEFKLNRVDKEAKIFADDLVDAVVVSSPDRFHISALEQAVASGKHALIDKPLADSKEDLNHLRNLLKEAESKGLVVSSCHPRRFDPPYLWLKDNMDRFRAELGEPLEVRLDFFYHRPSKEGLHTGLLSDHFNHEIDFVNFLFSAKSFKAYKLFDNQVQYSAAGIREDGISFSFFGNRALRSRTYHEQAEIRFERGAISLNTGSGKLRVEDYDAESVTFEDALSTDYEKRFFNLNNNFVQACLGKTKSYLSAEEMLINTASGIELTEAGFYEFKNIS